MTDVLDFLFNVFQLIIEWEPLIWVASLMLFAFGIWFLRQFTRKVF